MWTVVCAGAFLAGSHRSGPNLSKTNQDKTESSSASAVGHEPPAGTTGGRTPPVWAAGLRADVFLRLRGLRVSTCDPSVEFPVYRVATSGSQLGRSLILLRLEPRPEHICLLYVSKKRRLTSVMHKVSIRPLISVMDSSICHNLSSSNSSSEVIGFFPLRLVAGAIDH